MIVKIVVHGGFGAVGDDEDVLDAGIDRLLDDILDNGLIHQRQHFLGDRFGSREHARS
jgi:hypothetical protein